MIDAIVLLSGGLDSTTVTGLALAQGRNVLCLSFDYNQRHKVELERAKAIVAYYKERYKRQVLGHKIVTLGGLNYKSSSLTSKLAIPTDREAGDQSIPVTYVPARNSTFLAIAMGFAEALNADEIWTGFNAVDYSGYPDCRPEYVHAMQKALSLGTKRGIEGRPVEIKTPIISMSKVAVIQQASRIQAPIDMSWSCYAGGSEPCGECDSCKIRIEAFKAARHTPKR